MDHESNSFVDYMNNGKVFCDYCGWREVREISDPAFAFASPQIVPNISSSMKAAFTEFFRIYVNCFCSKNDKMARGGA